MSKLKEWGRRAAAKTGRTLLSVAEHADERGGEIRDQLHEKLRSSERLTHLREGLKAFAKSPDEEKRTEEQAVNVTDEKPVKEEKLVFSYGDERTPAQVFGGRGCPWTGRAVTLLESQGITTKHIDLDHPASGPMREELSVETGQMTVPYVYLRGQFVGGYNALDEIYRLGKLEYLTLPEDERSVHPDHGRFEIASRPPSTTP